MMLGPAVALEFFQFVAVFFSKHEVITDTSKSQRPLHDSLAATRRSRNFGPSWEAASRKKFDISDHRFTSFFAQKRLQKAIFFREKKEAIIS
jgi:hypothetical protein